MGEVAGIGRRQLAVSACLVLLLGARWSDSAPVIENDVEFTDNWNHEVKPHSIPFLNKSSSQHMLPPVSLIRSSEAEKRMNKAPRQPKKLADATKSSVSCAVCSLGVGLLDREVRKGTSDEEIRGKFVTLCVQFKIQIESVCAGIFDVYGPEVIYVMKRSPIGPKEICSMIFGETCGEVDNPLHDWSVELPDGKPAVNEPALPKKGSPTFKVLQISDTHYDPDYVEGSVANCQEPLCCRSNSTPPVDEDIIPAGKWGSYAKCDAPRNLITNMLAHIAETHPDIDYILWTGDLPPHDIWNQTREGNAEVLRETVRQMGEAFPSVPVFPAVGNHEAVPAGNFPPPWVRDAAHSASWLVAGAADQWRRWLPASASRTLLHGSFYSVLVRPGFRIVALNTNYCHTLSWWLMVNSTDPAKELKWLIYELEQAEQKGEKVHIIGHIPPGNEDCLKVWSANFYKIVERFEGTVAAQFYGHTHADEFAVFYEAAEAGRAVGVAYVAPSLTTYENHNPAYRIYYVDGEHDGSTFEVIDHETWTANIKEANENDKEPEWYRLYSAKEAYGLPSLRPREWAKLIERLVDDNELFELFYKHYYRDSPTRPPCEELKCKLQILCDLKTGRSQDRHHLCHDLELAFGE